jgi:protein-S-isoprenylcysteine O-methyltransferase Ste14
MAPQIATLIAWIAWVLSWIGAAYWADRAERRPARGEEWLYRIVSLAGALLLFFGRQRRFGAPDQLWSPAPFVGWALFALVLAGFAFAWWARLYLGRLWSSSVTRKAGHRVVDAGPYAIVRHPIYSGLLLSIAATAAGQGTVRAVSGFLAFVAGFWIKARLEERFLSAELGPGDYETYRRRVPMLIPFGPRG